MKTVIKYLKLPFTFSPELMQAELSAISESWIMHYNQRDYEGEWSALPLRSVGGSLSHVLALSDEGSKFADTPLMSKCRYLKSVVDQFDCEHMAVRLLKLRPGAVIKEHRDGDLGYEQGEVRIHVPILTNPHVEFYSENERLDMKEGECWYVNFDLPHSINNFGDTDRVHLVMDMKVSDQIKDLFVNTDAGSMKMVPVKSKVRGADKALIIEQLRAMNTPMALQMANEMSGNLR